MPIKSPKRRSCPSPPHPLSHPLPLSFHHPLHTPPSPKLPNHPPTPSFPSKHQQPKHPDLTPSPKPTKSRCHDYPAKGSKRQGGGQISNGTALGIGAWDGGDGLRWESGAVLVVFSHLGFPCNALKSVCRWACPYPATSASSPPKPHHLHLQHPPSQPQQPLHDFPQI